MKVQLRDVQLGQLNTESLLLVSRFSRVLKQHNGKHLSMQGPNLLNTLAVHARKTRNEELKEIYAELKAEILCSVYDSIQKSPKKK